MSEISIKGSTKNNVFGLKATTLLLVFVLILSSSFMVMPVKAAANMKIEANTLILIAGAENQVTFTVTNNGNAIVNDVIASLNMPSSLTSGTSMILLGSDGSWSFGTLSPGAKATFVANIYVSPSAVGTLIELSFTFTYVEGGTDTYAMKSIGMSVANKELTRASLSPRFSTFELKAGTNNTFMLIVDNVGNTDATNVSIILSMPGASSSTPDLSSSSLSLLTDMSSSMTSLTGSSSTQFMLTATNGGWNVTRIKAGESLSIPIILYASPDAMGSIFQFSVALSYNDNLTYRDETKYVYAMVPTIATSSNNFEVEINNQNLIAGQINNVSIKVKNTGDFTANMVTLQVTMPGVQLSSSSLPSSYSGLSGFDLSSTSSSMSLVIINNDGTWTLGNMASGEEREVSLNILATPSSAGSVTSITAALSYTNNFFESKEESKSIGILVNGIVDIMVLQTSTYPVNITVGKAFSLSINIINLGTSAAEGMIIIPSGNSNFTLSTSEKLFLGDIEANVPASFTLSYIPADITTGHYVLPLSFTYKDNLGQNLQGYIDIPFSVTVSNTSSSNETVTQSSLISMIIANWQYIAIVAVVIVALAVILLMRKRSGSKQ